MGIVRASGLLREVAAEDNLLRAWERVRDNDMADGIVSAGAERFARRATAHLSRLAAALLAGTYSPNPLTGVEIPKEDGSVRRLGVPSIVDRVVERALVQVLVPVLDPWFSPWSFAYRPGLGVSDAIRALVAMRDEGARVVVSVDFRDCFDRLPRALLLGDLDRRLRHHAAPDVVDLVGQLMGRPVRRNRRLERSDIGVTQGGPLSPLLCNLLLTRFDQAMLGRGWPAIRYADDLVAAVSDRSEAEEVLVAMREEAAGISLELAEEKTEIREFAEGFVFLGEDVNHRYPEHLPHELRPVPDRRTLYVGRQGAIVKLRRGQLVVEHRDEPLAEVPSSLVSHLVVFGVPPL